MEVLANPWGDARPGRTSRSWRRSWADEDGDGIAGLGPRCEGRWCSVTRLHPDALGDEPLSYALRRETSQQVWRNRVGVTGSLFGAAMWLSWLLGRDRR